MKRKALMLLAGLLATGLIAAGCGGDDDDDGGDAGNGGEPLTKQEFITQADGICSAGNAEIEAGAEVAFGDRDQPPSPAEQERFAEEVVILSVQNQVDRIRELQPPEGDEEQVDAILDAAQEGLDAGRENPALFTEQAPGDPLAEASRLAKRYGLKVCGE